MKSDDIKKLDDIKKIIKAFDDSKSVKLSLKIDDFEMSLEKEVAPIAPLEPARSRELTMGHRIAATNAATLVPLDAPLDIIESESLVKSCDKDGCYISSPMVGTFYRKPAPDAENFADVGGTLKKGQVICIIEAMKIMNEIEAEFDCKIISFLVEDGEPVEYGTKLLQVEKI